MKQSESIGKLAAALVAAQTDMRAVEKSATNPHFKSKYVPLDAIVAMARPVLAKHGIAIVQSAPCTSDQNALEVETALVHASGEWIANVVHIPLAKKDPQGAGAAVTYGRRFGLSSLLSIASEEDDDGNAASRPRQQARAERPAPRPTASTTASAASDKPTSIEPADAMWNGKRLGDMEDGELAALSMQMKADGKKGWVRAIAAVRGDRALGVSSAPHRTDAENVDRAMQKEAEFQSTLPG